jgi:hypothetical protein
VATGSKGMEYQNENAISLIKSNQQKSVAIPNAHPKPQVLPEVLP